MSTGRLMPTVYPFYCISCRGIHWLSCAWFLDERLMAITVTTKSYNLHSLTIVGELRLSRGRQHSSTAHGLAVVSPHTSMDSHVPSTKEARKVRVTLGAGDQCVDPQFTFATSLLVTAPQIRVISSLQPVFAALIHIVHCSFTAFATDGPQTRSRTILPMWEGGLSS